MTTDTNKTETARVARAIVELVATVLGHDRDEAVTDELIGQVAARLSRGTDAARAELVLSTVADAMMTTPDTIRGPIRTRFVCRARDVATYVLRHQLGWSWRRIGAELGRNHATVMASADRCEHALRHQHAGLGLVVERCRQALAADAAQANEAAEGGEGVAA